MISTTGRTKPKAEKQVTPEPGQQGEGQKTAAPRFSPRRSARRSRSSTLVWLKRRKRLTCSRRSSNRTQNSESGSRTRRAPSPSASSSLPCAGRSLASDLVYHIHRNFRAQEPNPDLPQQGCDLLTAATSIPTHGKAPTCVPIFVVARAALHAALQEAHDSLGQGETEPSSAPVYVSVQRR